MLRHVTSPDGVSIACEVSGEGPPLVLVHGAGSARWSFDLVRPELESHFTVIAVDRRGRGDSSDGQGYEVEREFEDMAAVVRDAGDGALLVGHSYGALIAAGAAQLLGDQMVREFFREVAGFREDEIDELALSPVWERRKLVSPTLPRELRAEGAFRLEPDGLARLETPTLMLLGSESPDWARRSTDAYSQAIPNAEIRILEGHGHGATTSGPELLAAELERFLR